MVELETVDNRRRAHTRKPGNGRGTRKLNSESVLERLGWLFVHRGIPEHIRLDNGPEFTAEAVRDWLGRLGVETLLIEPGSPWEAQRVDDQVTLERCDDLEAVAREVRMFCQRLRRSRPRCRCV